MAQFCNTVVCYDLLRYFLYEMNLKRWIKPFQNAKVSISKIGTRLLGSICSNKNKVFFEKKTFPDPCTIANSFLVWLKNLNSISFSIQEFRIKRFTHSETLQNLIYFVYKLTLVVFVFHFMQLYYFIPYEFPALC